MDKLRFNNRFSIPKDIQQKANEVANWIKSVLSSDCASECWYDAVNEDIESILFDCSYNDLQPAMNFVGIWFFSIINDVRKTFLEYECHTMNSAYTAPMLGSASVSAITQTQTCFFRSMAYHCNRRYGPALDQDIFNTTLSHSHTIINVFYYCFTEQLHTCPAVEPKIANDVLFVLFGQLMDKVQIDDSEKLISELIPLLVKSLIECESLTLRTTELLEDLFNQQIEELDICPTCLHNKIISSDTVPTRFFEPLKHIRVLHDSHGFNDAIDEFDKQKREISKEHLLKYLEKIEPIANI